MSHQLSWDEWLSHNIERNCALDELQEIMQRNGFSRSQVGEMTARACANASTLQTNQTTSEYAFESALKGSQLISLPNALEIENGKVEMYGIDDFLSNDECMQLVDLIRNNRRRSTTTEEGISSFRTSTTCELASLDHPLVQEIDQRICQYMGIDPGQSEPIEGQWYEAGQEFKAHTDYFDPDSDSYKHHIGDLGQRTWTFMIYLNTTREGGATFFSELDLEIRPTAGTAVLWNNSDPDGQLNSSTLHQGMPVKAGYKAVITKWFRSANGKPQYKKEANELLKPLTKTGFLKKSIPGHLHKRLIDFYRDNRKHAKVESIPDFISIQTNNQNSKQPNKQPNRQPNRQPSVLIELTDELRTTVHNTLQPMVEAWIGDYLQPTYVYGIREYQNGAVLKEHRDRVTTHVASVILNIDQEVSSDWPLIIDDHYYRSHSVVLKPGEMVFYEGARLQHGRPGALHGQRYANVFVHYKQNETQPLNI